MIVIQFWYIVCNVFVYLNIIYVLIPACRAAAIQTEDAYEYPEEQTDLETFSPEITEPVPKGVEKVGAFEDMADGSDALTTTKSSDLSINSSLVVLSNQNQTNGTEGVKKTNDLTTVSITTPGNDMLTNVTDISAQTESITDVNPSITTLRSETSDDLYNESTTTVTTPLNSSDSTSTDDPRTPESTTKPIPSTIGNFSESTTVIQSLRTTATEFPLIQTTNAIEPNESISENSPSPLSTVPDPQDVLFATNMTEKSNQTVETATQSLLSDNLKPKISTKDTLEQLYDEEAAQTTKFTPRYEEGYHDPKRAPTRYAQHEEYIMTTNWKFASDYGIGIRDYNLILYAVNNSAVLEKGSLLNYVYFVFKEVLHVNMTLCDIRYCRYLRSKTHDNTKKVPPVLVAFTKMDVKNEILHKRKLLKPTGIKVEHDMPKKILDEQNALLKPLMDKYRAMGQYVVVRSGKLLVEGKVLTQINLPDKYTYDPLQTFVSYVSTTAKPTTVAMQLPREFVEYGFGGDKKSGRKKKGVRGGGGKKKRKPMIRIPLDDEIGHELSVEVLFTTRRFWL